MLIITIPKSAGTALMETLARAHDIPCTMHYRWQGPRCPGFPAFHLQHAFDRELSEADVATMLAPDMIYKTHVLPSENNLKLLAPHPRVVLLRDADGIVGAYKRGHETGVYRQKNDSFAGCRTEADWIARAKELHLYQDLVAYDRRWRAAEGPQLLVEFSALVSEPGHEIARIEDFFGLPRSGARTLLQRKYTRAGEASLAAHRMTEDAWKTVGRGRTRS